MAETNLLLAALIERAGISHAGLAKRLNAIDPGRGFRYDHASVARWIRDHAVPRHPVPELICAILSARLGNEISVADIGMAQGHSAQRQPTLARAVDRAAAVWHGDARDRVPTTTIVGAPATAPVWEWENPPDDADVSRVGDRRADPADVTHLRRARAHYQEMYRRVGGVPVRPRIVATLTEYTAPLLRSAYDNDLGRSIYRAAGGLAALAGVCAYDADQQPLAQAHLFTALRLAKASGDREFGGYIVALLANQALFLNENRLVVQYAESALRAGGPRLTPALTTDLYALAGKAYARMGDGPASRASLRRSEGSAARIAAGHGPAEVSYVLPGLVETQVAEALRRLGDLRAARSYAEESVRTAAATHLRGQVHRYAGLALVLTEGGEHDRGAHIAGQMLDHAVGMESGRIRDRINTVVRALRPHAAEPAVAAFLERADEDARVRGI
ncbi:transcriptional regulator [Actinoplanes sp. ATCC 53533]|uniref:transcriptional regulator n=1 Tax=Actinoplanes sp. ATCC 53533 TaxID=1288362 RepID=UPI000F7AD547|nr:transcriptional regulator [Actinoplanes sp. ATCC 53533]RSM45935.1 transcriptional regulator [Actinoplanes sp. ATCC 53533]